MNSARRTWSLLAAGMDLVSIATFLCAVYGWAPAGEALAVCIIAGLLGLLFWSQARWGWCP